MSNKKTFATTKAPATDTGTAPPKYQPPPIPNNNQGILKHPSAKDIKQYPQKIPENVKVPPLNDQTKFYPPNSVQNKLFQYPQYPPPQQRPEEPRVTQVQIHQDNSRPRPLDEPGIPIHPDLRPPPLQHRQPLRYEEEFLRQEMLKFVRKPEDPRMLSDQTRHMQSILMELKALREQNQHLADDNQELRDLCCFLDDDRQKGRKLAREWQRFGRYTASVMRQEVSAYQSKLRELDNKQQELIKDNLELKELCLYLDEERGGGSSLCPSCGSANTVNVRDDGDGSSSSTNADEAPVPQQFSNPSNTPRRTASRERLLHENLARQRNTFNDQIMQYVRSLEQRVKQLEEERCTLAAKLSAAAAAAGDPTLAAPAQDGTPTLGSRPEAVVRALQVLEVREQLEREGRPLGAGRSNEEGGDQSADAPDMDDGEKALVREMCNVVWRKLEEVPSTSRR